MDIQLMPGIMLKLSGIEPNKGQIDGLPKNPRFIKDDKFKKLVKSIEDKPEMTAMREILVYPMPNGKYVIIGGNMRYRAMKELKCKEAPCKVIPQEATTEQLKAYTLKDNSGYGEWDFDLLGNEWDDLPLTDWGVPVWETEEKKEEPEAQEDDFNENEVEIPSRVCRGDIWQLGNHRLMCGDSTSAEDVEKLRGGELADLVFTDPPYGMKKEADGVLNDNLNYDDLLEFNKQWIPLSFNSLKPVGSWYCWGIDEPLMDIYSHIIRPRKKLHKEEKITFCNLITWSKGAGGMGVGTKALRCYFPNEEKCLFVMKGQQSYVSNKDDYWEGFEPLRQRLIREKEKSGLSTKQIVALTSTAATHYFAKSQWMMITEKDWNILQNYCAENGIDAFRAEYDQIRAEWYKSRAYFDNTHENMNSVWNFPITSPKERELCGGHATPKPIALCARAIKSSCPKDGLVLDVFGGSGSTLIACEQTNRRCLMMELDPHYCDVIIARWETLTGKQAVKIA
jgi:DNA modification methylase